MNVFYFSRTEPRSSEAVVEKMDSKGNLKEIDELYINWPDDLVGAVYDYTQCSDKVKNGDILFIEQDGGIVAVLHKAWPVQLSGRPHKELHRFKFDKGHVVGRPA